MVGLQNLFSGGLSGSSSCWFAWFWGSDDNCGECLMHLNFAEIRCGSVIDLVLVLKVSWTVVGLMVGSVSLAASSAAPQHCGLTSDSPSSGGPGPPPCHSATTGNNKHTINNRTKNIYFWRHKKSLTSNLAIYIL